MKASCITIITAIATSIGAIATAAMAYLTRKTLCENRRQFDETIEQWKEENRAILAFRVVNRAVYVEKSGKQDFLCIEVSNIGNRPARDVCFTIEDPFVDLLLLDSVKDKIRTTKQKLLKPNEAKFYPLSPSRDSEKIHEHTKEAINKNLNDIWSVPIIVNGCYREANGGYGDIKEKFSISDFLNSAIHIKEPIEIIADATYGIEKCLRNINHDEGKNDKGEARTD